jgi:hypothetical protein
MCCATKVRWLAIGLLLCCVWALPSAAVGDVIGAAQGLPDIFSADMMVNYDAASGTLTVFGCPQKYNAPDAANSYQFDPNVMDDFCFVIDASLPSPTLPTAEGPKSATGSLMIYSEAGQDPAKLLLSGTIDTVGLLVNQADHYALIDFAFRVTGGSEEVVSDFGGLGALGGTLITANYNSDPFVGDVESTGTFADSFSYNDICNNLADTFHTVPEPSSVILMLTAGLSGLAASVARRSWKRRD